MFLVSMFGIVIGSIFLGYLIGLLQNGINIHRYENANISDKIEVNDSGIEYLDPEVRSYYEQNNGMNKY
jgi:hypothetical protein